ncbi:hypothetical protein COEREDRAFT_82497 [Coemansia reversa NRRL 1564]|uniref:Uncharacterized protein n=1 Tax=Coemansia reversa (strain ATCC 12441 / NRRL 1564) TaxID=763665 RepID=A0A2G5B6W8_COERN|nr:hypothetical protein COEREDRAFT_82497 [Coemansia reversa NRRL 1564]|eukprot:PIA14741.1 hypothetical protein COEREDRAFT_82497 [Coemansia reversa NRRL 1564]
MYKTKVVTLSAVIAALSSYGMGEDLLDVAGTVTDTKSFVSEISANWVSVFYKGNMVLQSLYFMGNSDEYDSATSLYGTTALPAEYPPTWAAGYLSRAQQTVDDGDVDLSESDSDNTGSDNEESSTDDQGTSNAHSDITNFSAAVFGTAFMLATLSSFI